MRGNSYNYVNEGGCSAIISTRQYHHRHHLRGYSRTPLKKGHARFVHISPWTQPHTMPSPLDRCTRSLIPLTHSLTQRTVTSKVTSSPSSRKTLPLGIFPNLFSPMVGDSTVAMVGRNCTPVLSTPVLSTPVLCCPEWVLAVTATGLTATPGCKTSWLRVLSSVIACTMGSEVGDTPARVACASACARGRGSRVA